MAKIEGKSKWIKTTVFRNLPKIPACYVYFCNNRVVYVGSTSNLKTRLGNNAAGWRCSGRRVVFPFNSPVDCDSFFVKYKPSKKYGDWAMVELRLIRRLRPLGNMKNCKREASK